jgi:protein-S-isoprenylcysteine O-methyltransferase Ste14
MTDKANRGPGLCVPPPLIYVAALLAGVGLNHAWPVRVLPGGWGVVLGIAAIGPGIAVMPALLSRFLRAHTPFNPYKPASALITSGPYRYSRNPAYMALTLWYLGVGLILNSAWILVLVVPPVLVIDRLEIPREEGHLETRFGEVYLRYKAGVRRWL